jgi:hypothetical protein
VRCTLRAAIDGSSSVRGNRDDLETDRVESAPPDQCRAGRIISGVMFEVHAATNSPEAKSPSSPSSRPGWKALRRQSVPTTKLPGRSTSATQRTSSRSKCFSCRALQAEFISALTVSHSGPLGDHRGDDCVAALLTLAASYAEPIHGVLRGIIVDMHGEYLQGLQVLEAEIREKG